MKNFDVIGRDVLGQFFRCLLGLGLAIVQDGAVGRVFEVGLLSKCHTLAKRAVKFFHAASGYLHSLNRILSIFYFFD